MPFGSVLTEKFNNDSDIDLVVNFEPIDVSLYADNYYDFKFSLQDILNRPVDLLEEKAIKNPYFKEPNKINKDNSFMDIEIKIWLFDILNSFLTKLKVFFLMIDLKNLLLIKMTLEQEELLKEMLKLLARQ